MPQTIDWRYHRLNCNSCAKAESFLTEAGIETKEQLNARKVAVPRDDALTLLQGLKTLFVVNGKKVYQIDLAKERPTDDELCELIIGRSGSLRAPALKFGKTLIVGFDDALYQRLLG